MVLDLTQEVHGISAALSLTDTYTCSSTDDLWWLSRVVPLLLVAGDKGDISLRPRWERVLDCLTSLLTSLEFGETPEIVVVYSGLGVAISFAELDKTEKAAEWYQWALNRARLSGIDQEVEKDFGPLFKDPDISAFPTATEQSTVTSAFQNITRLISPLILQEIYRLESNVPTRSEQRAITS
jgi:hypothetical protein